MAILLALMLQILALLTISHSIPISPQFTDIPEIFIPASLLSTNYGINLITKNSPKFPISTNSDATLGVYSQEFAASTQGAKIQLQQFIGSGINGFGVDEHRLPPSSTTSFYNTDERTSNLMQNVPTIYPFAQMGKPEFQQLPISTISQQTIPSSVIFTKSGNESLPYLLPNNKGVFGTLYNTQNPFSNYIQSVLRPDIKFSNIADKSVVTTVPITLHNTGSNIAIPSIFTNAYTLGSNIPNGGLYPAVLNGLHLPKYGALEALLQLQNSGISSSSGAGVPTIINTEATSEASGQGPGVQTQVIQLPCTLHIPSAVPITLNPGTSASQVSAAPQIQQSVIPSSFIDNSPPTIAILRPPTSSEVDIESSIAPIATPVALSTYSLLREPYNKHFMIDPKVTSSSLAATTKTQENARSQDPQGVLVQNDEIAAEFESGTKPELARNGLPFVYTILPASSIPASFVSTPPVGFQSKSNAENKSSPTTPRPSKGNNPFFNVNKRKHFEFYQYF